MEEIWKKSDVLGDNYEISSLGRVRSLDRYAESTSRWVQNIKNFTGCDIIYKKKQ